MQGAYIAGYPFSTMYSSSYGIYFLGTYFPSLGLENFEWSKDVDDQGKAKSGPINNSKQFVKCSSKDEFTRALDVVKRKFEQNQTESQQ